MDLWERTCRVIRSCKTLDQLLNAAKYADLATKKDLDPKFAERCDWVLRLRFHAIKQEMRLRAVAL